MGIAVPLTRRARVALLIISIAVAIALLIGVMPKTQTIATNTTGPVPVVVIDEALSVTEQPAIAIAEPSAIVPLVVRTDNSAVQTVDVAAKKKAKKSDPGYVRDAQKSAKGLKFYSRHRIKDNKGVTRGWAYEYRKGNKACAITLATVGNNGYHTHKKLFRSVIVKDGKKLLASEGKKTYVKADVCWSFKGHGSVHVFFDVKYDSRHYASLDYITGKNSSSKRLKSDFTLAS